jgi:hypothetical protein
MIDAKHFVVFIVLMQCTCNIFHKCTNIWTTLVTCAGNTDGRLPDRLPSSTDSRPSTERLCHLKTSLRDTELVPFALLSSLHASVGVSPIFAQNLMIRRISRHFHLITVLTTTHKCLFTTAKIEFYLLYVVSKENRDASK